jgi:hypothetical protein
MEALDRQWMGRRCEVEMNIHEQEAEHEICSSGASA